MNRECAVSGVCGDINVKWSKLYKLNRRIIFFYRVAKRTCVHCVCLCLVAECVEEG